MLRMRLQIGVIVRTGFIKGFGAVAKFMDVHAEKAVRQMQNLNLDIDSGHGGRIEDGVSFQKRMFRIAGNFRIGTRP